MLALGVGTLLGWTTGTTQAASVVSGNANSAQSLTFAQGGDNSAQSLAATPGAHGQCDALTVSSVNGQTIVAKAPDGSTVTIHTTASTRYTRAGDSPHGLKPNGISSLQARMKLAWQNELREWYCYHPWGEP
jgi:hypothetical protein